MLDYLRFIKRLFRMPWLDRAWQPYWALEAEDVLISLLLKAGESPAGRGYVDIGAHHPRNFSTTFLLYRLGWTGLLVEPNPALAQQLRRWRHRDVVEQCAVSDSSGTATFYMYANPCYSTLSAAHAARLQDQEGMRPEQEIVTPVRTLRELAIAHPSVFGRAELLKVDAEGHDIQVLRSNDWSTFRPRLVVAEMLGETAATAGRDQVAEFLQEQGYFLRSFLYHSAIFERRD
jgi:FkbM family methyltransferase